MSEGMQAHGCGPYGQNVPGLGSNGIDLICLTSRGRRRGRGGRLWLQKEPNVSFKETQLLLLSTLHTLICLTHLIRPSLFQSLICNQEQQVKNLTAQVPPPLPPPPTLTTCLSLQRDLAVIQSPTLTGTRQMAVDGGGRRSLSRRDGRSPGGPAARPPRSPDRLAFSARLKLPNKQLPDAFRVFSGRCRPTGFFRRSSPGEHTHTCDSAVLLIPNEGDTPAVLSETADKSPKTRTF